MTRPSDISEVAGEAEEIKILQASRPRVVPDRSGYLYPESIDSVSERLLADPACLSALPGYRVADITIRIGLAKLPQRLDCGLAAPFLFPPVAVACDAVQQRGTYLPLGPLDSAAIPSLDERGSTCLLIPPRA